MLLAGKVTVITGGGRGIGRAIALKFAGEGAAAVVAARTESEIEAVAKEIRDAGGRAAAVHQREQRVDVAHPRRHRLAAHRDLELTLGFGPVVVVERRDNRLHRCDISSVADWCCRLHWRLLLRLVR